MQPYAFTGDDPLNATDPLGLMITRPTGGYSPSISEVLADPRLIEGWTPNELQRAYGRTAGWKESRLSSGSAKGQGLKLNEENEAGNVTDKMISYHPPE